MAKENKGNSYPPIKGPTPPCTLPPASLKPRKTGVSPMDKRYQGA